MELELQNARLQAERSPRQSVSTDPFFDVSRKGRERVQANGVRATECPITSRKVSQTICEY